ncbi:nitrogenase stabilizing/protective protein NifW [Salipiger sp. PrR002]|uniref:nitrogenase stabilizing/protective protein NifW n=1 Tax=Salipiger sp. PrR002 TaxID=2706489 RepID=UPI0013B66F1A|nr:nitrogenase stabilizing/protective protein NifW [Salipiger sp. PrR002]NDV99388.1 nitrogenase stabilizing/protective protein NifW [Salipiger sp. PrR002]NDW55874.1 nitrogenase stabilizing/protective protein NifW [Salipiger sp. PrR004]
MPKDFEETGVLDHIGKLSSAEDIFTYLLLPFEQEVVNVSRLHIMKRFGGYLRDASFDGLTEEEVFLEARGLLKQAYADFLESTPLKEKVFKVFRDEEAKMKARFVGLDTLKLGAQ